MSEKEKKARLARLSQKLVGMVADRLFAANFDLDDVQNLFGTAVSRAYDKWYKEP